MSKLEEISHEMLVLMLPRVSSRVSGFPVASPCLWGKLQNISFSKVSTVKIGGSLARNVRLAAPACLVSSLWFSCGFAVSMGEAAKHILFRRSPTVKIGGSLARNVRLDAPTCLVSSLWFSGGFAAVSMWEAAKHLLFRGFQAGCHVVLPGRRGTL